MATVYRVSSIHGDGVEYFNTAREADRFKPGGEEPESVIRVDAAAECNRLERYTEQAERTSDFVRHLLEDLWDACSAEISCTTEIGRRVNKFIAENPLPPADHAERDGQRSYGV